MNQNNYNIPSGAWGDAVTYTRIDEDGKMWIGNNEYESQVNFCPVTGEPAPVQMVLVDKIITCYDGTTKTIKEYTNE